MIPWIKKEPRQIGNAGVELGSRRDFLLGSYRNRSHRSRIISGPHLERFTQERAAANNYKSKLWRFIINSAYDSSVQPMRGRFPFFRTSIGMTCRALIIALPLFTIGGWRLMRMVVRVIERTEEAGGVAVSVNVSPSLSPPSGSDACLHV